MSRSAAGSADTKTQPIRRASRATAMKATKEIAAAYLASSFLMRGTPNHHSIRDQARGHGSRQKARAWLSRIIHAWQHREKVRAITDPGIEAAVPARALGNKRKPAAVQKF